MNSAALESQFQSELNKSPLTRPMWMLWILSAGLIALDGFDFFIIGVAMPFIQRDFGLSAGWVGAIATAALAGALVGSLTLGPITDKVGRQLMLVVDIGLFVVASAATAFAWNAWSLLIFRFLVGVGIGADYPISVAYITENIPARLRGRMVIGAFSFQSVGALLGALVGWLTIFGFEHIAPELAVSYAWRWMLGVGIVLSIMVGGLRLLFLLESPSYYLAKGEIELASEAASELLAKPISFKSSSFKPDSFKPDSSKPDSSKPSSFKTVVQTTPQTKSTDSTLTNNQKSNSQKSNSQKSNSQKSNSQSNNGQKDKILESDKSDTPGYRDLFSTRYIRQTALASVPWFLQDIATYGIGIFTPTIIATLAFSTEGELLQREMASAKGAAIVNVFLVVGFLLAVVLINRAGRIALQMVGFVGMAIGLCLLSYAGANLTLLFAGFILFNLTMNLGPNSTTFLLSGEVFPPAIRASGAGLAGGIAKAGAVLGALGLPILQESIGVPALLQLLACLCILAALITYALRSASPGQQSQQEGVIYQEL